MSSNRFTGATIVGSPVRTESYTNSGHISQDVRGSDTYGFTYNNDGRLSTASLNSSTVGTYVYNGLEQRVSKTASSVTTQFVFDNAGHLMSEDDASGNPIREYIWLDDMPVAMVDSTGMSPVMYFIHTDHLGKPQKMTDGGGTLVWDAIFKPFGEAYSVSGTATNLLMFPGQFYNSETGLAQNWYRDYDATLGRYIESDPIGLGGGINTYAYVGNNAANLADPYGLWPYLAPTNGFDFLGVHVPAKPVVISQLQKSLQLAGICEEDSKMIAGDIVEQIGWGDLSNAKSIADALQNGKPLSPEDKKQAQKFIQKLPSVDRQPLNNLLLKSK